LSQFFLLLLGVATCSASDLLTQLPHCNGLRRVPEFRFEWQNYEKRMKQLKGSEFLYFTCQQLPATASDFYRSKLNKPPYNLGEVNWVARREGTLGIYYDYATKTWTYLWVVPSAVANESRVVVARSRGEAFHCRLRPGPLLLDRLGDEG
jgi:hypothetical protein